MYVTVVAPLKRCWTKTLRPPPSCSSTKRFHPQPCTSLDTDSTCGGNWHQAIYSVRDSGANGEQAQSKEGVLDEDDESSE